MSTTAMFQSVGIFSGFLLPIIVLVLFVVLVLPGLARAGTRPESLALAAYGYLAQSFGIILMTAGGLPAVFAVISRQTLSSSTYLGLLLLFVIGGITYLWHDGMLRKVDAVSRAIPGSLFFYAWKFIGLIVTLFAGLSFLLELLVGGAHPEGWWVVHLVMFLYGLLLSWFTLKPAPQTTHVVIRPAGNTAMAAKIRKNVKQKAKTVKL